MSERATNLATRWREWCTPDRVRACWVIEAPDDSVNVHIVALSLAHFRELRNEAHRFQQTLRVETGIDLHVTVWRPTDAEAHLRELPQRPVFNRTA